MGSVASLEVQKADVDLDDLYRPHGFHALAGLHLRGTGQD